MIKFKFIVLFLLILTGLNSCGLYERADVKDNPINIDERVKKIFKRGEGLDLEKVLQGVEILTLLPQILYGEHQ